MCYVSLNTLPQRDATRWLFKCVWDREFLETFAERMLNVNRKVPSDLGTICPNIFRITRTLFGQNVMRDCYPTWNVLLYMAKQYLLLACANALAQTKSSLCIFSANITLSWKPKPSDSGHVSLCEHDSSFDSCAPAIWCDRMCMR